MNSKKRIIVEIGCGYSKHTLKLANTNPDAIVYGIDMFQYLRGKHGSLNLQNNEGINREGMCNYVNLQGDVEFYPAEVAKDKVRGFSAKAKHKNLQYEEGTIFDLPFDDETVDRVDLHYVLTSICFSYSAKMFFQKAHEQMEKKRHKKVVIDSGFWKNVYSFEFDKAMKEVSRILTKDGELYITGEWEMVKDNALKKRIKQANKELGLGTARAAKQEIAYRQLVEVLSSLDLEIIETKPAGNITETAHHGGYTLKINKRKRSSTLR